ncbi:hypothetical protein HELRODRAFT_193402 [Helobdella robusta]|uniref:Uncharacterized protein n=1 Tax=Helobdella robusta TaxID=6412 RepID=T1FUY6_HELRO|nr:hypothetical protein HELRODRAFT_193402 [Helobdella robusta]ESN96943.1 hypothetical protein HELRODRAFT_193402 [Helobdella robusta]
MIFTQIIFQRFKNVSMNEIQSISWAGACQTTREAGTSKHKSTAKITNQLLIESNLSEKEIFASSPMSLIFCSSSSSSSSSSSWPFFRCQVELLAPPIEVLKQIRQLGWPWSMQVLGRKHSVNRKVINDNVDIMFYKFALGCWELKEGSGGGGGGGGGGGQKEGEGRVFYKHCDRRKIYELMIWKTNLKKEACFLCSKAISSATIRNIRRQESFETRDNDDEGDDDDDSECPLVECMESNVYIEPCGEGYAQLTHILTLDLLGHSTEWYRDAIPTILHRYYSNLQKFFQKKISGTNGPETKV